MSESSEQETLKKYPPKQSAAFAGSTAVAMGLIDLLAHLGPTGLLVGGIASYVAWKHGPELYEQVRELLPLPAEVEPVEQVQQIPGRRSLLDRALGRYPQMDTDDTEEVALEEVAPANEIFTEDATKDDGPTMERITVENAIKHTDHNSYQVYVGRSLTDDIGRAKKMGFRGKHLKFIGASQRGKSSEIAALMTIIAATHDPAHVQVAILDLENKTGRLFADLPHIKRIRVDGKAVRLHATDVDQVLEYLIYITKFMELRYKTAPAVLAQQPILIVYIEEFLRLRRMLKARIAAASPGSKREKAQRDYAALIDCIDALAARGLKAHIQLWLCAQVDYVDEDLREALANVMEGMSFCVRPSAASAAGFARSDLITKNRQTNRVGQCVVETTDLTDLIQAIEFDLAARLLALGSAHPQAPLYQSPAFEVDSELVEEQREASTSLSILNLPDYQRKPEQRIPTLQEVIDAFPNQLPSKRDISKRFDITDHQAYKLYQQLERLVGRSGGRVNEASEGSNEAYMSTQHVVEVTQPPNQPAGGVAHYTHNEGAYRWQSYHNNLNQQHIGENGR